MKMTLLGLSLLISGWRYIARLEEGNFGWNYTADLTTWRKMVCGNQVKKDLWRKIQVTYS